MLLTKFLDSEKIPYFKINISKLNGKKKISTLPVGWNKMTYSEAMKYNSNKKNLFFINVILSNSKYMVIDIDSPDRQVEYLEKYGDDIKTKSTGRELPHLWRLKHDEDEGNTKIDSSAGLDFLYNNVFEAIDSTIENYSEDFPVFDNFKNKENTKNKKNSVSSNDSGFSELSSVIKSKRKITEEDMAIINNISISYLDNYFDWLKIIWGLNNEFENFELIKEVSMRSAKYTNDNDIKKYLRDDKKKLMSFGTICHYSKLSDKPKYLEIKSKYSELFFDNTDYEVAELYLKNSCDNVVLHGDSDYDELYIFKDGFWVLDPKQNLIKKDMRDTLFNLFNSKRKELTLLPFDDEFRDAKLKHIGNSIRMINTSSKQKSICEQIPIILEKKDYNFDCNRRELFCFKNTAYNLDSCKFENLNKYDYITLNCGYDYYEPTQEQIEKIHNFFKDIQPDKEQLECLKSVLRRGMYGKQDEFFVLLNGQGGNGKGVLLELYKELLSKKYFENGNTSVLTDKLKSSGANTELAKCDKKRTILYSEPEDGNKLNGATIKYVTGNPIVNARQLYSCKTETELHAMTIMECNERPAISGRVDNSFLRRIIDILFPTIFVDTEEDILDENYKLKDESFKDDSFKEDHKIALFSILCNAKKKVYIPYEVKNRSEKYIYKNDDVYNFIKDNYDITELKTDIVAIKDIFRDFKICDSYKLLSNEDKKSLNQSRFIEVVSSNPKLSKSFHKRIKIGDKSHYSVFTNIKPKQEAPDDFI